MTFLTAKKLKRKTFNVSKELKRLSLNKGNKKFSPQPISEKLIRESPVYSTPEKWISKFRFIKDNERIQSYSPLETSAMAYILSSPPRMTHFTRTVVPRDLLLPMRLMENPLSPSYGENTALDNSNLTTNKIKTSKSCGNFKYIIAPFHPDDSKIPEDPITYYPNDFSILRNHETKSTDVTVTMKRFSLNLNFYPNVKQTEIGWNQNTFKVAEAIHSESVLKELSKFIPESQESKAKVYLNLDKSTASISFEEKSISLNLRKMAIFNPPLYELIIDKTVDRSIPITVKNANFIRSLVRYMLYMSSS